MKTSMSWKTWRVFAILHIFGAVGFSFGELDGGPLVTALLPVGVVLLLPGLFGAMFISSLLPDDLLRGHDRIVRCSLSALAAAINAILWVGTSGLRSG
jgi:uncharacterized membrane protein YjjP (DUF1212 family)